MNITELRDWATATFGSHSHKEGQIHAALGPLEEWLGHLARHGVMLELAPKDLEAQAKLAPPLHAAGEPASPVNSGATGVTFDVPLGEAAEALPDPLPPSPPLDSNTFVTEEPRHDA